MGCSPVASSSTSSNRTRCASVSPRPGFVTWMPGTQRERCLRSPTTSPVETFPRDAVVSPAFVDHENVDAKPLPPRTQHALLRALGRGPREEGFDVMY